MQKIIQKFENAEDNVLSGENVCCYLISERTEGALARLPETDALKLAWGEGAAALCQKHNLDGAVLRIDSEKNIKKQVSAFQKEIGKKFFGLVCPPRRHEAMLCSECEPDFLVFCADGESLPALGELVPWYHELFLIQTALDVCADSGACKALDTDFIIINASQGENFGC